MSFQAGGRGGFLGGSGTGGGTDLGGGGTVSGNLVVTGTLNVQGAADFDSTTNHDGDVTLAGTSQMILNDGTATDPVLAFAGDLDTGFYRATNAILGFGGAAKVSATSAGSSLSGTASVVSLSATGAVTTAAANELIVAGNARFTPESTKTTTYQVLVSDNTIICNEAVTPFTVTLIASPATGTLVFIKNLGAATVTVGRNGNNIDGAAADDTLVTGAAGRYMFVTGHGYVKL